MRLGLRKLTWPGLVVLLGTLAIVATGCGSSSAGNALPDSQQVLKFPIITGGSPDVKTLDPAKLSDYPSYVPVYMTFPGMVELDATGNVIPWAITAMPTFDATADTYTFKIRPGLKWSDGSPIDASTFAYSINRSLNPCTGSFVTYYLYPIKDAPAFSTQTCAADGVSIKGKNPITTLIGDSLIVPDSQTLVIKLGAPAPYFLQALCYPTAFAQPEQLINQFGAKDWTNHLADNGGFGGNLFKVKVWDHKGAVDLIRNDAFWGTKPKLREIDFTVFTTTAADYASYLDGKLDQGVPPPSQYKTAKTRPGFYENNYLQINYYQPDWQKKPFDDVRVRQAFDLALNKDVLANQVNSGSVIPSSHIVPQGMPGYYPGLQGVDGASTAGNVAMATQLMQSYANDKCGGKIANCTPVTLVDNNDPATVTTDQAAVQMWQTAFPGLKINTSFIDFNTEITIIYTPNVPQIFGIAWITDYLDPQDWLSLQFCTTCGAINNTGFVSVPEADALMSKADTDLGPDRMSLYNQAEQLLVNQGAWIPWSQQKGFYNVSSCVHNFTINTLGDIPITGPDSLQTIYMSCP